MQILDAHAQKQIFSDYKKAARRAFFLDYDGTLAPFSSSHDPTRMDTTTRELLEHLARDKKNTVVIVSGRGRNRLAPIFAGLKVTISAEHGIWLLRPDTEWERILLVDDGWKTPVLNKLMAYTESLPGTFIEEKEGCIAWHFKDADPEKAATVIPIVLKALAYLKNTDPVRVLHGHSILDILPHGASKGNTVSHVLSGATYDFALAAGDDASDEDMFVALPENGFSIRIGEADSIAKYNLKKAQDFLVFLRTLAHLS